MEIKESLESICLSAEGRGRLHYKGDRNSFDFESLLDRLKKKWTLALHINFHGEEKFELSWAQYDKITPKGIFFKGIKSLEKKVDKRRKSLWYLVDNLGKFLKFYGDKNWKNKKNISCKTKKRSKKRLKGSCSNSSLQFDWISKNDQLIINFPPKENITLKITFKEWQRHFEEIHLLLKEGEKTAIKMSLVLYQCHRN